MATMKTIFFLGLSLMGTLAQADFNTFIVENLNVNYELPQGTASVDKLLFPEGEIIWDTTQNFQITKSGTDFIFDNGREQMVVSNAPDLVQSTQKFDVEALFIHAEGTNVNVKNQRMFFHSPDQDMEIIELAVDCLEGVNLPEYAFENKVFEGCLTNSTVNFSKLTTVSRENSGQQNEGQYQSLLMSLEQAIVKSSLVKSKSTKTQKTGDYIATARNFRMNIKGHNLDVTSRVEAEISGNLKIKGMAWYVYPASEAKIQIDKATFGWFSIKEELFQQLEKDTSGNIRVERPFVYLKL